MFQAKNSRYGGPQKSQVQSRTAACDKCTCRREGAARAHVRGLLGNNRDFGALSEGLWDPVRALK